MGLNQEKKKLRSFQQLGHRERLRERFMISGHNSITHYELIELILFLVQPRVDVKPTAKCLLETFGSLGKVLEASPEKLKKIVGIGEKSIIAFKIIRAALHMALEEKILNKPILSCWSDVINYCRFRMENLDIEQVMVIFVDQKHRVIHHEMIQKGTINQSAIYPREILKRALEVSALGILLVHNHPSGDPTPSEADQKVTSLIKESSEKLGIFLLDHIIIGKSSYVSFKKIRQDLSF